MIVAIGIDVDPTFAAFVDRALSYAMPLCVLNLRAAVEGTWRFEIPTNGPARLEHHGLSIEIRPDDAFYCRIIDLPTIGTDLALTKRWYALTNGLREWLDCVPGLVVNRWRAGAHNGSKPLHEALISKLGFNVPESITSSNRDELLRFVRAGPAISKTICGVRADATACGEADLENFEAFNGPVHLQRYVSGADARIHVIGHRILAQRVSINDFDYRRAGGIDAMQAFNPPSDLCSLLIEGNQAFGLEFAGWDFRIDKAGEYWCLEVNPMPGYSVYDDRYEGAISRELIDHLQSALVYE